MANVEIIELYPSPWSERLRWALEWKRVAYDRTSYQPLAGEDELQRTTGLSTVPVLRTDGKVVGDSDAAVEWLEATHPEPALLPAEPALRAQVRIWELAATECVAPFARLVMIGRWKRAGIQPLADHFAIKYHWTPETETRVGRLLHTVLSDVARAVESSPFLVAGRFTRADLTMACMLTAVIGAPPDELFALDDAMRPLFGIPLGDDPGLASLRTWRDGIYRQHRGRRVTPIAA
jgi:glutathione S-transferase